MLSRKLTIWNLRPAIVGLDKFLAYEGFVQINLGRADFYLGIVGLYVAGSAPIPTFFEAL